MVPYKAFFSTGFTSWKLWVYQTKEHDEIIAKLNGTADYPILIMTDAESGFPHNRMGGQYALAVTDSEDYYFS